MIIDKNKFKEYINDKHRESIHINEIKSISINNMKYHKDQLSKDSKYHEVVEKNGFVDLVMIKPIWSGWKVVNENNTRKELIGTWAYRDNRTNNRFSLEAYQEWLVDVRDKKLESIGI
jgi:hypothetical protein